MPCCDLLLLICCVIGFGWIVLNSVGFCVSYDLYIAV